MTYEETAKCLSSCAAIVKLICGVGNNAAWLVVLEGHDHAKHCRNYKHDVKRLFKAAIQSLHAYEQNLLYNAENRMFHLPDMAERVRKKYGDITDRQFYDFWTGAGTAAHERTRPLLTSLWNKYRLSLMREGVPEAEHVAWVMVAEASLELAVHMYKKAIDECVAGFHLKRRMLEYVFGQFDLTRVMELWRKAMFALCPGCETIDPSETDKRNIEHGLRQLTEAWVDPTTLYNSTMDTVEEYGEVFRTKGEQKKAVRCIAEARNETIRELQN